MSKKVPAWISEIVELAVVPPTECKNGWASRNWKVARDALEQNGCEWDQDYVVDVVGLLIDEIERLRALLNCRAGKLLQKGKTFVVVAVDEPYFSFVFDLIRKHEKHRGRWTDDDQRWYDQAIRESFEIESARAAGGGDE